MSPVPSIPNRLYSVCTMAHCLESPASSCPNCYALSLYDKLHNKGKDEVRHMRESYQSIPVVNYVKGKFVKKWLYTRTYTMLTLLIWKKNINEFENLAVRLVTKGHTGLKTTFSSMQKKDLITLIMHEYFFNDPLLTTLLTEEQLRGEQLQQLRDALRQRHIHQLQDTLQYFQQQLSQQVIQDFTQLTRRLQLQELRQLTLPPLILPQPEVKIKIKLQECCLNPFECPICIDRTINPIKKMTLNCGHDVCHSCFRQYLKSIQKTKPPCCSLCRQEIKTATVYNQSLFLDIQTIIYIINKTPVLLYLI
jgi:hypothetical protein